MNKTSVNCLRKALALLVSAGFSLFAANAAFAQAAASTAPIPEETIKLEKFVVTGSLLSAATAEGALPVVSYDAKEIASTGATTLIDYLKSLPFSGGSGTLGSNFTNGGNGTTQVALRGLGGENTLVLLNGRRLTPSGTGSAVDLNAIPFSAIERVDILKSGGSVVYGTDAVAGVINVILKKRGNGVQLYYGNTKESDVANRSGSMSVSGETDNLRFFFGASWQKENGLYAPDRDYAIGGGNSGFANPGRFFFTGAAQTALLAANGLSSVGSWTLKDGVNVATRLTDFRPFINLGPEDGGDRFPFENFTTMINPNERYNIFTSFDYKLLDDKVVLFGDFNFARTTSAFQLAPSPFSASLRIPATNFAMQQLFPGNVTTVGIGYRFADFDPRIIVTERSVIRLITGLRGDLTDKISYETSLNFSQELTLDKELNGVSQSRLLANNATNTAGDYNYFTRAYDPKTGSVPAGVPFNDPALINLLRVDSATEGDSRTQVLDFKLSHRDLLTLPAGSVEVTVGAEMRKQTVLNKPDDAKLSGSIGYNASDGTTTGSRRVLGGFVEIGVPILDTLSGTISYRHEKYRDEFDANVGGLGLRWQAIKDELTIRASYSTGFVAPALSDVFNPGFQSFPEIIDSRFAATDPLRIYQIGVQFVGAVAGGDSLEPEKSKISSIGFTYSPKALKGFSMTVDYAKITQENIIVYSVQGVVDEFFRSGAFADRVVTRADPTAPGGFVISELLNVGPRNLALRTTEYVDFEFKYNLPTNNLGRFVFSADATRYLTQSSTAEIGGEEFDYLGIFDGDVVYPKWKGRLMTRWNMDAFSASITGNYTGETVDATETAPGIEADWTVDAQVGYRLPFGKGKFNSTLTIGARNLLDNPPPVNRGSFSNNYPERSYDPRGRFTYVKFDQEF